MKAKQSEALKGNKNAKRGKHKSVVMRLSVELVDGLYECLQLDGELIEEDPERVIEFAQGILGGYVKRRIEQSETMIV